MIFYMKRSLEIASLVFTLCLTIFVNDGWTENSVLEKALNYRASIVNVKAIMTGPVSSTPAAAYDPQTGKLLIGKNNSMDYLERNGAGVIITASGYIVTNLHTIRNGERIGVTLPNGELVGAQIVHLMPEHDLALLKVDLPYPLTPIEFADSDTIKLGDEIVNIGHSELLHETISGGVVIGLAKSPPDDNNKEEIEFIKTNIDLYHGDSGGPLFNKEGRLIGMMMARSTGGGASIAIPSNKIKILYPDFVK